MCGISFRHSFWNCHPLVSITPHVTPHKWFDPSFNLHPLKLQHSTNGHRIRQVYIPSCPVPVPTVINVPSSLSSELVQIRAAKGSASFTVHKDILIAQSTLFESAVPGVSTQWLVDLPQWGGETVARVLEFLYRGRYAYPDPSRRLPDSKPVVTLSVGGEEARSSPPGEEPDGATDEHVETARERLPRFDPTVHNYAEALLAHVQVYKLAQTGSISRLLPLALKHISDTLSCFSEPSLRSTPLLVHTVIYLARYMYNNISEPGAHRKLLAQFIARNFAALNTTSSLRDLLAEGGPPVMDIMMCLHTRPATPAPADSIAGAPSRYVSKLLVRSSFSSTANSLPNRHCTRSYLKATSATHRTTICVTSTAAKRH